MKQARFDRLIGRYLDGLCDAKELRALLEQLEASDDRTREFVRQLYHERTIGQILAAEAGEPGLVQDSSFIHFSKTWLLPIMAASASLLAAFGLWWMSQGDKWGTPDRKMVARLQGGVEISLSSFRGRKKSLSAGTKVCVGDRLRTGPGGRATLLYAGSGTLIELCPSSDLTVVSGSSLYLADGGFVAAVERQKEHSPFQVATPQATVEVIGTIVGVEAGLSGKRAGTRIDTYRGRVKVMRRADGSHITLARGESVVVTGSGNRKLRKRQMAGLSGTRTGPDGEILREYSWELYKGMRDGLLLSDDARTWAPSGQAAQRGIDMKKRVAVRLPLQLRNRPCRVTLSGKWRMTYFGCEARLCTERGLVPVRKRWSQPSSYQDFRSRRIIFDHWIHGSRMMRVARDSDTGKLVTDAMEFECPPETLVVLAKGFDLMEMSVTEVSEGDLPDALRTRAAWQELTRSMSR